jgi:hypothetical protein
MEAGLGDLSQFDKFFDDVDDEESSKSQDYLAEGTQEEADSFCTAGADLTLTVGGVIGAQSPDTTLEEYQTNSKGAGGMATSALGPRARV